MARQFVTMIIKRAWGCLVALSLLISGNVYAESAALPARMQAVLIAKASAYDRGLSAHAPPRLVLLIARAGDPESTGLAKLIADELRHLETFAGAAHREEVVEVKSGAEAVRAIRARDVAVAYLSTGFDKELPAIAEGLAEARVLTVSGVAGAAERGAVLALETTSGHPSLVVNLPQAKRQHVEFSSALLSLARVIR